jgi:regulator of protease activity HflC (stomatin/prohibitin superfamily)
MADITSYLLLRHLRAESAMHVLHYRRGRLARSGRGLSFWFAPMSASIAEVPVDDREVPLAVQARTADYQDVTVQGVVSYRVADPEAIARRIDFTIDARRGVHLRRPLEKIQLALAQLAQQHASDWIAKRPVRDVLRDGPEAVRERIREALDLDEGVAALGLSVVSVRIASIAPSPDLERALESPMRERIQQDADEAAFARRALAVEKERAIQENELKNQIELARREEELIAQKGMNAKRQALEDAAARTIASESEAGRTRTLAGAQADSIRSVEGAKVEQERARMEIQQNVPPAVLAALAARELAGKLHRIDHLHLGGDALGPILTELASAGTRALETKSKVQ